MGLATNIEHWDMSAAIGMATEGVRAKYNVGGGGGGFGAADMEIASKLDGGKVLAAVDTVGREHRHLELWSMYAYASPLWNRHSNRDQLFEHIINDWVIQRANVGEFIQERTFDRVKALLPLIVGGMALEQFSGAEVTQKNGRLEYLPVTPRSVFIEVLVGVDCEQKDVHSETFTKKRTRYYQNNWARIAEHIEFIKSLIVKYDTLARKMYKKELEKQMMAI
ncbi:hypothetical protein [Vibrio algicola]|uniref:Uncharacterized protein n=1 Tax=Vibrio algicola TaxID=2662262 RepID=A0A5Q0TIS1_9VIBR|nr:hypothetical protein [Vibrio algicola]